MERRHFLPRIDPVLVREIFYYICNRLGLLPRMEASGRDFGEEPNEALATIAETILTIQMLIRDFLKRLFTSRSREIATDLQAAATDICTTIAEKWDGAPVDREYTMSAVMMELYLYCLSMRIEVSEEFFPHLWFTKLAPDFAGSVVLRGGQFEIGDPYDTSFVLDFQVLSPYIYHLTTPYQSIPIESIEEVQVSRNHLVRTLSRIFNFHSNMNIQRCTALSLRRMHEALSQIEEGATGGSDRPSREESRSPSRVDRRRPIGDDLVWTESEYRPTTRRRNRRRVPSTIQESSGLVQPEDRPQDIEDPRSADCPSSEAGPSRTAMGEHDLSVRPKDRSQRAIPEQDGPSVEAEDSLNRAGGLRRAVAIGEAGPSVRPKDRGQRAIPEQDGPSVEAEDSLNRAGGLRRAVAIGEAGPSVTPKDRSRGAIPKQSRPPVEEDTPAPVTSEDPRKDTTATDSPALTSRERRRLTRSEKRRRAQTMTEESSLQQDRSRVIAAEEDLHGAVSAADSTPTESILCPIAERGESEHSIIPEDRHLSGEEGVEDSRDIESDKERTR